MPRAALALTAAVCLLAGCASDPTESLRAFASVKRLPDATALAGQSRDDQQWDVRDCQAEAGHRTLYSPKDSPMGNLFQKLFFWGTAGAALGGTVDGFPIIVNQSTASTGLIVGASTGGAAGAALSLGGQSRYEAAWATCMRARGYSVGAAPSP
jgi:hypothetical protein